MIQCEAEIYERWLSGYLFDDLDEKDASDLRTYLAADDGHVTQFYQDLLLLRQVQQASDGCDAESIARALKTRLHAETEESKRIATHFLKQTSRHAIDQETKSMRRLHRKGVALLMAATLILGVLYGVLSYVSDLGQSSHVARIQYAATDVQVSVANQIVPWAINEALPDNCTLSIPDGSHLAFVLGDGSQCQLSSGEFVLRLQGQRRLTVKHGQCDWRQAEGPQILLSSPHGEVAMSHPGALRLRVNEQVSTLDVHRGRAQLRAADDSSRDIDAGELIVFGDQSVPSQL